MSEASAIDEQLPPEPVQFRAEISRADGRVIPLTKRTHDGLKLFISAAQVKNPLFAHSPNANPDFWKWDKEWDGKFPDGVLLVDVYGRTDAGEMSAVGHMDWWISGETYANGGGNEHGARIPANDFERAADEKWNNGRDQIAFSVVPEYQQQGIGRLMLATSGVALPAIGITRFYSGALLEKAQKTYAHFGINKGDFPLELTHAALPIERLSQHPQVSASIEEFLTLQH